MTTIAIVSIPNAGHIHILTRLAYAAKSLDSAFTIKFILTGWSQHTLRDHYIKAILENSNEVILIESETTAHCKGNTFGRARELADSVIKACADCDYIIYDFMTPEGYIAGKVLSIPTLCAEPSYVGEFDTRSEEYLNQVQKSRGDIQFIEKNYKIELIHELKLISGALSFPSSTNILFSWEKLIRCGDFEKNSPQEKKAYYFSRPPIIKKPLDKEFAYLAFCDKKVIYFSLGTIASGIAWEETSNIQGHSLQRFIIFLYNILISLFIKRQDLILIISTGRSIVDIVGECALTDNIHVYESLDQANLLHYADLFITHCGANSVNEALDAETPMIGIPLMYDQHQCAQAILTLGIGHAFLLAPEKREEAVYLEANTYFRSPFDSDSEAAERIVEEIIDTMLNRDFSIPFSLAKSGHTLTFEKIYALLKKETVSIACQN